MEPSRSQVWHWLALALVLAGCGGTDRTEPLESDTADDAADSGVSPDVADAGSCPKPDGGRIQLTRRGCPAVLEIGIQ